MRNKIGIFGSNSFSGSEAAKFFLKKKYDVFCFSKDNSKLEDIRLKKKFIKFNINNINHIKKAVKIIKNKKISFIINYISKSLVAESWKKPENWYYTNSYALPIFYFKLAKIKSIKKVIHFSTPEVYGNTVKKIKEDEYYNPTTPYAVSRVTGDHTAKILFKFLKFPIIITRASNVYGEKQDNYRIIPKSIKYFKTGKIIPLDGSGKTRRNFIHISDVNNALNILLKKGLNGETYHISGDKLNSIKSLVKLISEKIGVNFHKKTKSTKDRLGKDLIYQLDTKKIKRLKWKPIINLSKSIINMIKKDESQ